MDWGLYFYGACEKYELFLLRDLVQDKAGAIFLDVGANIGQHSLFMSQYCDVVHSFEPYEPVRRQLDSQIDYNAINNIIVHGVGLGHTDCDMEFFAPKGANTGTGSFVPSHARDNNEFIGKLRVVNGDAYISRLGLKKIDLIKIDVEGFEKAVLIGLRDTLIEYRPIVFLEFSSETKRSFESEDEMMSLLPGYSAKKVQTNRPYCIFFNKPGYSYGEFNFNISGGNLVFFP